MANDISISVKVNNQTAGGLTAVNASLQTLKTKGEAAGSALTSLSTRAAAADTSMRSLANQTDEAKRALTELHAAAHDLRITAALDDQTSSGVAAITAAVEGLKAQSPIELTATFSGSSGEITAVVTSLQALAAKADDAGSALTALAADSAVADTAMQSLKESASAAERSLTDLHAAARDVRLTVEVDDQTSSGVAAISAALQSLRDQSPVRLTVTFDGDTAQITAAAAAMRSLKTNASSASTTLTSLTTRAAAAAVALEAVKHAAEEASSALTTVRARAAAAAAAMADLRNDTIGAAAALRTLNTRSGTANTNLDGLSGRTRTLRTDMDDLDGSLTRVSGSMGGVRGNLGSTSSSSAQASGAMEKLMSAAIMLAPALIPIAASLAPIIPLAGAAGLAVGAFGAAIIPQISAMSDAAAAQTKYSDAQAKYGKSSAQAAEAEGAYLAAVQKLPPATREAAASLGVMKDRFSDWSDSLAGDTMPVATKGFALLGGTIGKLSPLVKTSSTELSRMVTIIGGGVESRGFDTFMDKVDGLAKKGLRDATTGLLRFGEAMSSGKAAGPISEFMTYARDNGPAVSSTMKALGEALLHLVESASDVGVGMLTVVNAMAHLVSAVPPEVITDLLQLAIAIKAVRLATAGGAAIGAAATAIAAGVGSMRTAAAGASGPLASLTAAFGALSKGAQLAVAGTAIGLLVIAVAKLSSVGKSAPPDVDQLNASLGKLAQTGKVSGEAARAYGKDLTTLGDSLRVLARPSNSEGIQQWMTQLIGMDSTPVKKAKEDLDAVDKALANMVGAGHADLAAAAFNEIAKAMQKQGLTSAETRKQLDDYKQSLVDQAFEQKLVAQSMGLFGDQAVATKTKLDAQKQSADGLRQAIQALNDVNRAGLGGMIAFEASIDAAAKAAKENAGALNVVHGQLDLNSEKSRNAASALSDLAAKTDEAAGAARDQGQSWSTVNGIYDRGRANLIKYAMQMGLTRSEATRLAGQILKIPDKTTRFKGETQDLDAKIKTAQARVDALKQKTPAQLKANGNQLQKEKAAAQKALDALKQKKVAEIRAHDATGPAAASARAHMASVKNRTATLTINEVRRYTAIYNTIGRPTSGEGGQSRYEHGGITGAATGGPRSRRTLVGEHGPEIVDLAPGSRVRSNPDTKRMLAGGTAGDGGGQPIVVQLHLDGRQIARALVDPLRGEITNMNGGDVQAALGRGRR